MDTDLPLPQGYCYLLCAPHRYLLRVPHTYHACFSSAFISVSLSHRQSLKHLSWASSLAPATLGSEELPAGKPSAKRQEWNGVQPDFGTSAGPEILESDLSLYIFAICEQSTIWGEGVQFFSENSYITCLHWSSLQSTYGLFHKDNFCWVRNTAQDKDEGLGRMTEVNRMPVGVRISLALR